MVRERCGCALLSEVRNDGLVLGCEGLDGVTRRTRIHCQPAPWQIDHQEMRFRFDLDPKGETAIVFAMECENEFPQRHAVSYSQAMRHAESETKALAYGLPREASSYT